MFRLILNELLATTGGAVAAVFLDYEGETVELVCDHDLSDHDLRVIGAHQGIFLTRLRAICTDLEAGALDRMKVEFSDLTVLSCELRDGYFFVLLLKPGAGEAIAWRRMERCREKLLAEM